MADADASSRGVLINRARRGFRQHLGSDPEWLWFAPGRIEIFGKHTDYAGGRSLLCTVPRGIAIAARRRSDQIVRVLDLSNHEIATIDLAVERSPRPGLDNYASVVVRRLAMNFPNASLGAEISILSDLPRAAGVSSSSALVVGIASALIRRGSLDSRPEWLANITSVDDQAWYLGCMENGLTFRGLPSSSGVGTLGGSEDHTAILACRAGHVSQYRFVPVQHLDDVAMPQQWTFVVAVSGVEADKAGSVRDLYNRASRATQVLLEIWNSRSPSPARSLGEALAQADDAEQALRDRIGDGPASGFTAQALLTRLTHFAREDRRVPAAADAFARVDASALGRLAADSQRDADELLGNQVPETRALVELALAHGAFAASAFGAGFGGSVWALVDTDHADRLAGEWLHAYRREVPAITQATTFVSRPGPPLTALPVTV